MASGNPTDKATASVWSYTWYTEGPSQASPSGFAAPATVSTLSGTGQNRNSGNLTSTSSSLSSTGITAFLSSTVASVSSNGQPSGASLTATNATITGPTRTPSGNSSGLIPTAASTTSFLPVAAYSLPPSGTSIAPDSPAATDAAVVVGTLLLALVAALAAAPLAEAAADAAAAAEVEAAIAKIEPFLTDLGVDPKKSSCGNGSSKRGLEARQTNPFGNLDKHTTVTDISSCAEAVLIALQAALTQATPDAAAMAGLLLENLTVLGNNAQKVKEDSSQQQSHPTKSLNSMSSTSSSTSSATSTSSGCSACCTWETAATDGGIAAITPALAEWNDIDGSLKRAIPDRFERMGPKVKRASTGKPIPSFKGSASSCVLNTPPGLPVV